MATYNLMKAEDRARKRADRQAELDAARKGLWPRNSNDQFRWGPNRVFVDVQQHAEFAAEMCESEIAYLDDVERRLGIGDPDLAGWEVSP
jgi:hypothetical protein